MNRKNSDLNPWRIHLPCIRSYFIYLCGPVTSTNCPVVWLHWTNRTHPAQRGLWGGAATTVNIRCAVCSSLMPQVTVTVCHTLDIPTQQDRSHKVIDTPWEDSFPVAWQEGHTQVKLPLSIISLWFNFLWLPGFHWNHTFVLSKTFHSPPLYGLIFQLSWMDGGTYVSCTETHFVQLIAAL